MEERSMAAAIWARRVLAASWSAARETSVFRRRRWEGLLGRPEVPRRSRSGAAGLEKEGSSRFMSSFSGRVSREGGGFREEEEA